ncbi:hypothetical protein [Salinimicrobium sp. GXAS 041]|uniref:hypothetical protein n=1 Tax=Salinimicrobium sp. GXAS 041 TaxID=3400806 RepID=UPI003C709A29
MDAKTIYALLKPHLETMEPKEKKSLSNLIVGLRKKRSIKEKRRKLSLTKAKEKIRSFRKREMERELTKSAGI